MHLHARPYLSILVRGSYTENYGPKACECLPGHAIFHASGEVHSDQFSDEGGELVNLEILPDFEAHLRDDGVRTDIRAIVNHPHCTELALKLRRELSWADSFSGLVIEGIGMELTAFVLRARLEQPKPEKDWIESVDAALRKQYTAPPSLAELAAMVHVHPVHVARTFRKRRHCSVGEYVRILRLEAACRQLRHTELPIAEIAANSGFADQSHLSRTLKRYMGVSPTSLRAAEFKLTR